MLTETTNGSEARYTYDGNGNTLTKTTSAGVTEYAYDDADRLIEARDAAGVTRYVYNVDGLRVRQTHMPTGGIPVTTWYLQDSAYPNAEVVEEWTQQGDGPKRLAATYAHADDLISQTRYATDGTPTTSFVQADGFGSTRWLTDETGSITDSIDYSAFGEEIWRTGETKVEHLYRGERFDANVAMYDLRARLFNPRNGRFLTQDSFKGFSMDPQSLHKYAYTHADPINYVDPSGHFNLVEIGTTLRQPVSSMLDSVSS